MRVRFLLAILWIGLSGVMLPVLPQAQTQGAGAAQPTRPTQQDDPANPFVQGVIQLFIDEALRNNETETQPPAGGGSTGGDDVQAADRQGPVIRPVQNSFTSTRGRAQVVADITDASGVARAVVVTENTELAMTASGGRRYSASVPLAAHYRPVNVGIRAWDRRQNASKTAVVAVRRLPACGSADDVSVRLVQSVQRNVTALGRYRGGIDGLAGPNTCGAIAEEGFSGAFSWPAVEKELDWRVAVGQISLNVIAPPEATGDTTPIGVRVIDPRNSGAVGWVQMRIDGVDTARQQNSGSELRFDVTMPEGATREVSFLALSRRAGGPLATQAVTLSRPGPMDLFLSGEGLIGDRLESDDPEVGVMARVEGSDKARIFFHNRSNGQRGVLEFFGTPVAMPVVMPDVGERGQVVFWAEDGNRTTPPRRINLRQIRLPGPSISVSAPARLPSLREDPAPDLVSVAPGPGRGVNPLPLTTFVADNVPSRMVSPPPFQGVSRFDWLLPAGIGFALMIALAAAIIGLFRRGFRQSGAEAPAEAPLAPPAIRVVAHPDTSPVAEVTGGDLPGLVLTVDPGAPPTATMEFETDFERAAQ